MMKPGWSLLFVSSIAAAGASEPTAVCGQVEKAPAGQFFSAYFLRDPHSGGLLAGLRDPQDMLRSVDGTVTLQVEKTTHPEVNGLPILKVINVSPNYFAQPSAWIWAQRGAAAFSRFGMDPQPKDFAGTPFTIDRAYHKDNGLERRRFEPPLLGEQPAPLRFMSLYVTAQEIGGEIVAQAGLTYELHFAPALGETPVVLTTLTPVESGPALLNAPRQISTLGFYFIRAVAPPSL